MGTLNDWKAYRGTPEKVAKDHLILDDNALPGNDVYRGARVHIYFPSRSLQMTAMVVGYIASLRKLEIHAPTYDGELPWVPPVGAALVDASYIIEPIGFEPMTSDAMARAVLDAEWGDYGRVGSFGFGLADKLDDLIVAAQKTQAASERAINTVVAFEAKVDRSIKALQTLADEVAKLANDLPDKLADAVPSDTSDKTKDLATFTECLLDLRADIATITGLLPAELVDGRMPAHVGEMAPDTIDAPTMTAEAADRIADHVLRRASNKAHTSQYGDKPKFPSLLGVVAKSAHPVEEKDGKIITAGPDPKKGPFGTQFIERGKDGAITKIGGSK